MEEHSRGFGEIRQLIVHLDQKVDRFRGELAGRIDALDQKVDRRIDTLDQRVSRHFLSLAGLQVTTLLTIVGLLLR